MDARLEDNILKLMDDGVEMKAHAVKDKCGVASATKQEVNKMLYTLQDRGLLVQTEDHKWRKVSKQNASDDTQPKLLTQVSTSDSSHFTPEIGSVEDQLKALFLESPERTFETLELARGIGKSRAKDVNKYLYQLKNEGFATNTGNRQWQLKACGANRIIQHQTEQNCFSEMTDGQIDQTDGKSAQVQTHPKRMVSLRGIAFDVIPNLEVILMENIWPGPTLLCKLTECKYISAAESNRIQDTRGLQEKCQLLVNMLKLHRNQGITVQGLAEAIKYSGQNYLAEFLMKPDGKNKPMSKRNRDLLTSQNSYLYEQMVLDIELMNHLKQNGVITDDIEEHVSSKATRGDKIVALLHALERCGDDAVPQFRKALKATLQEHTALFGLQ